MVFNHNSRFYSNSMFLCSGDLIVTHRSHLHFIKSQLRYFHNIKTISLTFCNKVFFFQEYLIRKQYSFICQETIRQRGFLISLSLYFSSRRLLRFRLITRIIELLSIKFVCTPPSIIRRHLFPQSATANFLCNQAQLLQTYLKMQLRVEFRLVKCKIHFFL